MVTFYYKWPYYGMTVERYDELMGDTSLKLTREEMLNGWDFDCVNWDGLLIHKTWPEANVK